MAVRFACGGAAPRLAEAQIRRPFGADLPLAAGLGTAGEWAHMAQRAAYKTLTPNSGLSDGQLGEGDNHESPCIASGQLQHARASARHARRNEFALPGD